MHFLRVNVTFYDAVNMTHDVMITANPFSCTTKLMFVGFRNNKTQHIKCRLIEYVQSVAVYKKYLTRLGEMPRLENCQPR